LQNGNRGFGNQIKTLLLVTSDLGQFVSVGKRNQCWVDGGMFAMSLLYALHSLGVATCCLNWSVRRAVDHQMKRLIHLPDAEVIIMLIAVGHYPPHFHVTRSPRKPLRDILTIHSASRNVWKGSTPR
jgi:nitroreductase